MSFGFEDGDYLAWSVEVRREKNERVLADRRCVQIPHARLSRHDRTRFGPAALERARRGRAALSAEHAPRAGARRSCSNMSRKRPRSPSSRSSTIPSPPIARRSSQARPRGWGRRCRWTGGSSSTASAWLPVRSAGGRHDDAAQRADGARAHQRAARKPRISRRTSRGSFASACPRLGIRRRSSAAHALSSGLLRRGQMRVERGRVGEELGARRGVGD